MATIFRPARPSRRVTGGRKAYVPGAGSIRSTTGTAAGIATVSGVGVAIITAIGLTDGAASVNGVGVGINIAVGTAAGTSTASGVGTGIISSVGVAAGATTASGVYDSRAITSTRVINKPVDYVLAGQQVKRQRLSNKQARHAFGE